MSPIDHAAAGSLRPAVEHRTLSQLLWSLDLYAQLPRMLSSDGVEAVRGDVQRVRGFLLDEFPSLTEEGLGASPIDSIAAAKQYYLGTLSDLLELRHQGRTVGVFIGAPEDWSTYYIRTIAIAPSFRRPGMIRRFARECIFGPLTAGSIERVEADTSPSNVAMARALIEQQFLITGQRLSDRYGPLVRYTRFLDRSCAATFHRQFSGTAPWKARVLRKEESP